MPLHTHLLHHSDLAYFWCPNPSTLLRFQKMCLPSILLKIRQKTTVKVLAAAEKQAWRGPRLTGYHLFMGLFNSDILHADAPHILSIEQWYLKDIREDKVLNHELTKAGIHHRGLKAALVKMRGDLRSALPDKRSGAVDYSPAVGCALNAILLQNRSRENPPSVCYVSLWEWVGGGVTFDRLWLNARSTDFRLSSWMQY